MKDKITLNKENCKILICCHKPCELPPNLDGLFLPIQVGAAISDADLGMQRDDQVNGEPCDNISAKNKSYCELTALYWAWKNIKKLYPNLEYIGLNHYRRYFSFDKKNCFDYVINCPETEIKNYKVNKNKLKKILYKNEIVLSKNVIGPYSLEVNYSTAHFSEDIKTVKKIVHEKYPEYDSTVYNIFTYGFRFSPANMMIMKWCDFCAYAKWLFGILEIAEKNIDIKNYNPIQKRVFGYLAERLFNVWINHNIKKIKFLNILMFCSDKRKSKIKIFLSYIKANLIEKISGLGKKSYSQKFYNEINGFEK
ncbi:DUF4422 domain-containing protein [uncultured Treponema sp.]|uniref:DUF4422 domain-containing protein n=1 Tax=uncultured Treponema sp. TaxID=162155 RepID=UPI0025E221C4|nr:DUF4422 domain-containing protein [uncultured Treponema sp.]